jgi:hypothetical protein
MRKLIMARPRYYIHLYTCLNKGRSGWGVVDGDCSDFIRGSSVQGVCMFHEAIDAQTFCNYLNYQEFLKQESKPRQDKAQNA